MPKIVFLGAGSTVFARNVLGDCMCSPVLSKSEITLYDIDAVRLKDSELILNALHHSVNEGKSRIKAYLGVKERKEALQGADFVVNAIQVGGYDPSTILDFEIPKKYGLRQTIADTLGIGGIMRGLRTIPVLSEIAKDMEEVCPHAWFLNYTNPMAILTGFMQRYTKVKTIGLCHSVQTCSKELLTGLGMEEKLEGRREVIAGINHMGWLLEIKDKDGNDLYPEIRKRAIRKNQEEKHKDMVRYEYIRNFGYYCTESSEHNAEYNPFFIKSKYPELIEQFQIPLDEYPRRCICQIEGWEKEKEAILHGEEKMHIRSTEYASYIMESIITNQPYKIGGNVLNGGLIDNLPPDACVEVPCLVDGSGITPCRVGSLPLVLAAMNSTNIYPQLLTIEAALKKDRELVYQAAMLEPHTAAELSIAEIKKMCDELIAAHGDYLKGF